MTEPREPGPAGLAHEVSKRHPFDLPEQEVFLNLVRTHGRLLEPFERLFRSRGLTQAQYNVLRILRGHRGSGPSGAALSIQRIGEQMLTREPDMTRLIARLEARRLVRRNRCPDDRRVVHVSISETGLELLAALDHPLLDLHRALLAHMPAQRIRDLNDLLVEARSPPRAP